MLQVSNNCQILSDTQQKIRHWKRYIMLQLHISIQNLKIQYINQTTWREFAKKKVFLMNCANAWRHLSWNKTKIETACKILDIKSDKMIRFLNAEIFFDYVCILVIYHICSWLTVLRWMSTSVPQFIILGKKPSWACCVCCCMILCCFLNGSAPIEKNQLLLYIRPFCLT